MDDSPTANAETLRWLESEGFLGEGNGLDPTPRLAGRATPVRERDPRDRALEFVRAGAPNKGIEFLMQEAGRAKSSRTRFLRRTEATRIMVESGLDAVALPILRQLAEQIDQFQLEQWESGDLVAEPLGLLYRCLRDDTSAQEELYLRICRLDPIHAMTLGGDPDASEQPEQSGEE
jgi:type VI secretion system protein ImpA